MPIPDQDIIALVDASLDVCSTIQDMVTWIRREDTNHNLLSAMDTLVWALMNSKHASAPERLAYIRNNFDRYRNIN